MYFIPYNPKLKERARELRKNSTRLEIKLWQELRGGKLGYTFNRQKPLDEYIVDFYCKELKLVIEVDGDSHNGKQAYDRRRQQKLESFGLKVIRFYDDEVMKNIDGVVWAIQNVMRELESKM
ncbi:MAG TPA: DUF559 domain-containing protein [Balneolaceae bacterium]|nr:DUF559 domain-containing protein [Balneolaceae bacterium]